MYLSKSKQKTTIIGSYLFVFMICRYGFTRYNSFISNLTEDTVSSAADIQNIRRE